MRRKKASWVITIVVAVLLGVLVLFGLAREFTGGPAEDEPHDHEHTGTSPASGHGA